jgi:hypothetical protein
MVQKKHPKWDANSHQRQCQQCPNDSDDGKQTTSGGQVCHADVECTIGKQTDPRVGSHRQKFDGAKEASQMGCKFPPATMPTTLK